LTITDNLLTYLLTGFPLCRTFPRLSRTT